MQTYAYPVVDGVKLSYDTAFEVDGDKATVSGIILLSNVADIIAILRRDTVKLDAIIGHEDNVVSIFNSAKCRINKLTSRLNEAMTVELEFERVD